MTADRRRWLMGGAVVVVLGVVYWMGQAPAPVAGTAPARARAGRAAAPAPAEPFRPVQLEALEASLGREEPADTARNPFRFQSRAPVAAPRPAAPVTSPAAPRPAPAAPAGPPPASPIPLKFIGIVERANGVKWAVLSDGRVTLHGRDGDIIDGRYRIVKIGTESIELSHADGRGRQTIRLTGQ